ncbi:MAG: 50S ribosomal protein L13 [Puniceicoccales bacterium]|jgi:large subunit ribosomal protein L13|nr:50S ribosomal protein L13 [Puniceicoccales bacterium]
MKTTLATVNDVAKKKWRIVDAAGVPLGRLAVVVANILRGRDKPLYTPHMDAGDFVIVTNAAKVKLTGAKDAHMEYMFYSGFQGGEKYIPVARMRAKRPEFIVEHAVRGMLPKNRLAEKLMVNLKVYGGSEHPHAAQQPMAAVVMKQMLAK